MRPSETLRRHSEAIQEAAAFIAQRVALVAPPGLPWLYAMETLLPLSEELSRSLIQWGMDDTEETRAVLFRDANAWVQGWRIAGEEWIREGRPTWEELDARYRREERFGLLLDGGNEHLSIKKEVG